MAVRILAMIYGNESKEDRYKNCKTFQHEYSGLSIAFVPPVPS